MVDVNLMARGDIAAEMCITFLILAAQCFENVPEDQTPAYLLDLLAEQSSSPFVLGPGELWIREITKAYNDAAEEAQHD